MTQVLVLRFSAMGDVALVAPVVRGFTEAYPDVCVTVVTRPKFAWFFEGMERVTVVGADIDDEYKGFLGLFRLFLLLRKQRFDAVVDLHDHLRTKILRAFFNINGTKVVIFEKGRTEKRALTRRNHKIQAELPHTTLRYAAAFVRLGGAFAHKNPNEWLPKTPVFAFLKIKNSLKINKNTAQNSFQHSPQKLPFRLGVAPFAKHENKQWGLQNIIVFIDICIKKHADSHILLFGGGAAEIAELAKIHALFPKNTTVVAGKYSLIEEIELMQTLDVMLCMDSSNLHLAALAGVATVSVWGATHPSVGFAPYGSPQRNRIVQTAVAELPCRPCSVFGDKPCFRGDKMCMASIAPEQVWSAVEEIIFP